ncbi:MAG: formimidoylglutamase [Bacteroidota bacterium]
MDDISQFFSPVDIDGENQFPDSTMGSSIQKFLPDNPFPELKGVHLALLGIEEDRRAMNNEGCGIGINAVRPFLYSLFRGNNKPGIIDLGNIRTGHSIKDSYFALTKVCHELIKNKIIPIVIGGGHDLAFAMYRAYEKIEKTVNLVSIDARFDLGGPDSEFNSQSFLGKIILHQPNILFNYSNIGYQTYFVEQKEIELFQKLFFDAYRLGQVQTEIEESEPIIRAADMLSFDMTSIRMNDAPGNGNASPNGFYSEEACQLIRYAGLSNKLTSIGFFEMNPKLDKRGQTAHLLAQMIWYFIEGFYLRKNDFPFTKKSDYLKYRVAIKHQKHEIVFLKSKHSDRWWMEVPYPMQKRMKFERQCLVPCSYNDYKIACREEMPDRWWQTYQKLM